MEKEDNAAKSAVELMTKGLGKFLETAETRSTEQSVAYLMFMKVSRRNFMFDKASVL